MKKLALVFVILVISLAIFGGKIEEIQKTRSIINWSRSGICTVLWY
ncbi:hypothetical protein [Marinitoga sp. 38H-ov]|nr:hypothetical protein [Marinitoga sp. 38H-ov]